MASTYIHKLPHSQAVVRALMVLQHPVMPVMVTKPSLQRHLLASSENFIEIHQHWRLRMRQALHGAVATRNVCVMNILSHFAINKTPALLLHASERDYFRGSLSYECDIKEEWYMAVCRFFQYLYWGHIRVSDFPSTKLELISSVIWISSEHFIANNLSCILAGKEKINHEISIM